VAHRVERRKATIVVVDRGGIADNVRSFTERVGAPVQVLPFSSVLEVLGESGPQNAAGLIATTAATGPFLGDLLRWTDREHDSRIPAAVVGRDSDEEAVASILGRDHVKWIDAQEVDQKLDKWVQLAIEVNDLRAFHAQHEALAAQLREARMRLFYAELDHFSPPEGPPCGPPLPTTIEEIQSLKEAKAQFERGLIRAAVRESGSLKDASAALGISYTSLWRRMR
jgi:hypothetical protein